MITEYDFNLATGANSWKRVGDTHPVNLYYGKDDKARNAIEYSGKFSINRKIHSSVVIEIAHYTNPKGGKSIVFSLLDSRLLRPFCDFLNTMIEATEHKCLSEQDAYNSVCEVYFIMQKMFRSSSEILSESEIKGLIGELLFLRDTLIPQFGATKALSAWSGTSKTRKDFALDNEWFEIKAIDFGKDTVHISSIEQLDSPVNGTLVIFQLERMAEEYDGVTLNKLVKSVMDMLCSVNDKDTLASKLYDIKYSIHPKYDEFVYEVRSKNYYNVDESFPRISRAKIPVAISKASFDLVITEILPYKK